MHKKSTIFLGIVMALGCGSENDAPSAVVGADQNVPMVAPADAGLAPDAMPSPVTLIDEPDASPSPLDAALPPPDAVVLPPCEFNPPAAATRRPGKGDGEFITISGRRLTPAGRNVKLDGFPGNVVVHPSGRWAYISSMSSDDRRLYVLSLPEMEVIQNLSFSEIYVGLTISIDGTRLFASGGDDNRILVFDIDGEGRLTEVDPILMQAYVAGLSLGTSPTRIWAADFITKRLLEIDTTTSEVTKTVQLPELPYDVLYVPARNDVYVTALGGSEIYIVNADDENVVAVLSVGPGPTGLTVSADGSTVYAAVSGRDQVVVIDSQTREITKIVHGAPEPKAADGQPLANSNVNNLTIGPNGDRLYVSRGADNAISVFDIENMDYLGAIPTSEYPTAMATVPMTDLLIVSEGRGGGSGPNMGRRSKSVTEGSSTLIDLADVDLDQSSAQVTANFLRPQTVFPVECNGRFPIPASPEQKSPIEHVLLVVKENKTFDCVFGDLDPAEADVDPSLVRYGENITPNLHALARAFSISDNFYTEVEDSDVGHILLTSSHVTEFVQRIWLEKDRSGQIPEGYQFSDNARPEQGNFFTHLMDNDIDVKIFGEIVGMFTKSPKTGRQPVEVSDEDFPGGIYVNYRVKDEDKARFVAQQIREGQLAQFTYLLLPNDHTVGTRSGEPTPESMVADNDYAIGILVEALAASEFWDTSAMIIVQDDPQGCRDHVDAHRSFVIVVSPWAKRGHVSHVLGSFMSVFATIERILNVPPMGRGDATAAPLWDMFTATPEPLPFQAIPRIIPVTINGQNVPGARASRRMNFRGPDRNAGLAVVLDAYRLWRQGKISRAEADRRIANPIMGMERWTSLLEESFEESFAFDHAFRQYAEYLKSMGKPVPKLVD